jgi:long-chain acyl-CoA synthetase
VAQCTSPEKLERKTKNIVELLQRRIAQRPDREAFRYPVADQWRSLTWKQAGERIKTIAAGLLAIGITSEQRVGILANTRLEWILCDFAVLSAGGATTTVYPSTTADDCAFILSDSDSQVVFVEDNQQLAKLRSVRSKMSALKHAVLIDGALSQLDGTSDDDGWAMTLTELEHKGAAHLAEHPDCLDVAGQSISPTNLATLVYTSGTTGQPKGVKLLHECWAYCADAFDSMRLINDSDVQFLWLPLSHVFGKVLTSLHVVSGSVCAVDGRIPNIIDNLAVIQPTFMAAAPRIFEKVYNKIIAGLKQQSALKVRIFEWALSCGRQASALRQQGREPTGLLAMQLKLADKLVFDKIKQRFGGRVRFFVSGSAPLSKEIAEFFHACGILILEGYGLTESSAASFVNRPRQYAFGSVGVPLPGTEVKLAESDSEILIRSPGVMSGYHNLVDATAEALTPDGWLRTGDIGQVDARGFLRITDRKKDLIKTSGGKYVAPASIEGKLKAACPYISQVVVHGDRRNFCSALITVDEESIVKWAADNGHAGKSYDQLVATAEVKALFEPFIKDVNKGLAKWETVKTFAILPQDFTIEAGELTPSLKVKRKVVEKKYMTVLDKMYEGSVAEI